MSNQISHSLKHYFYHCLRFVASHCQYNRIRLRKPYSATGAMVSIAVSKPHCTTEAWTAGQRIADVTGGTSFMWKVMTPNGYEEWPMYYTNWMRLQPDYTDDESCLSAVYFAQWDDVHCSADKCYLCEYETAMPFGVVGDRHNCSGSTVHLSM